MRGTDECRQSMAETCRSERREGICFVARRKATELAEAGEELEMKESLHAATVSDGGERSWISAAVNLSRTFIGPAHLGQRQSSFDAADF
jgi:hypothetical protein